MATKKHRHASDRPQYNSRKLIDRKSKITYAKIRPRNIVVFSFFEMFFVEKPLSNKTSLNENKFFEILKNINKKIIIGKKTKNKNLIKSVYIL